MNKIKRLHLSYVILILAVLSLGATYGTKALLEIGPIATVTGSNPEIRFLDTDSGDPSWEIEAHGATSVAAGFLEISPDGSTNGTGQFKIHTDSDEDQLTLDENGNVAINAEATQTFNELEVFGNSSSDTFSAIAITPDSGSNESTRLRISTTSNESAINTRGASGSYSTPFVIDLDAPSDSLTISEDGNVGLGVGQTLLDPAIDLTIDGGQLLLDNSAAEWQLNPSSMGLWFDQDGTASVMFNNDAPEASLAIEGGGSGNIGMGTSVPDSSVHVLRSDGTAQFRVEEANGTTSVRQMMNLINNGGIRFSMENSDTSNRWDFTLGQANNFAISLVGTGGAEFNLSSGGRFITGPGGFAALDSRPNGDLIIAGTLFQTSDRDQKENFQPVNAEEVLDKIAKLPISTWNYKSNDDSIRHMGPIAQDFRRAFELGQDDKTIAPVDTIGASLAAIQALNNQLKSKDDRIANLESELDQMNERMESLENAIEQLMNMQQSR